MSKINDGGPAFPASPGHPDTVGVEFDRGMSLRDWFAGRADPRQHNQTLGLSEANAEALNGTRMPLRPVARLQWWAAARAAWRYMEADAMLAERAKGGDA